MDQAWDEKAVFLEALSLAPEQREEYLRRACPTAAARARIDALLRAHREATAPTLDPGTGPAESVAPPPPPGERIDEFRLLRLLGEGGMGAVYLAEDTILNRQVALKVLARHLTGSEQALGRFREEARSAAALKHPAIVPVYKFGFDGANHYIVSEYVDGPTLAQELAERAARAAGGRTQDAREWHRRCAEIVSTIADALDDSHRAGIVHRDVKPSNILLDRSHGARLTDFGVAKHLTEEARTKGTGVVGSCHYMSPEQASIAGARVDQRSDIFSLGVVLYEMLAGRRPFDGPDMHQVLNAVISAEPTRLRALDRRIPADLETICRKAMEKNPTQRYQTAAHLAADLRCFLSNDPILARPPSVRRRAARWARLHRRALLALLVLVFGGAAATGAYGVAQERQRRAALAWLRIDAGPERCRVSLRRFVESVSGPEWADHVSGWTPMAALRVERGQYRLVLTRERDGAFGEFNLVLDRPGPAHATTARLLAPGEPYPPEGRARAVGEGPRTLVGVARRTEEVAAEGMVRVAPGVYRAHTGAREVAPALEEFYIDTYKVSNREYWEFLRATGYAAPNFGERYGLPDAAPDLPVVGLSLEEAEAYARWRGKRLATLAEWQAAARGPAADLYPQGRAEPPPDPPVPDEHRADILSPLASRQMELFKAYALPTRADDGFSTPGRPEQVYSSVRELTATVDASLRSVAVVGRAWFDQAEHRTLASASTSKLFPPNPHNGFRCARSARAPAP